MAWLLYADDGWGRHLPYRAAVCCSSSSRWWLDTRYRNDIGSKRGVFPACKHFRSCCIRRLYNTSVNSIRMEATACSDCNTSVSSIGMGGTEGYIGVYTGIISYATTDTCSSKTCEPLSSSSFCQRQMGMHTSAAARRLLQIAPIQGAASPHAHKSTHSSTSTQFIH